MSRSSVTPASPGKVLGWIIAAVSCVVLLVIYLGVTNSEPHEINAAYGRRRGNQAADSVNGTAVLASMFEAAGHKISTITMLGRSTDKFDTVVWIPDNVAAPKKDVEQFFERWLREKSNRTLIYIGRDYDASPEYWQAVLQNIEPKRKDEYERRWAHARARADAQRSLTPDQEIAEWFTILGTAAPRKIDSLDGPWAAGIEVSKTSLEIAARLDLPPTANNNSRSEAGYEPINEIEILLQSENDILVHEYRKNYWSNSRVIVVANGSFLLNFPLVNKENRKLAGKLISACSTKGNVAFLESDSSGPRVLKSESEASNHALHLFTVWPISFIFIHFAALGIAYCISTFPIFGRPMRLPKVRRSDFGQHVAALGALLKKTRNVAYAEARVRTYLQQARRGSGKSHSRPLPGSTTLDQTLPVVENKQMKPNPTVPVSSTETPR